MALPGRRAARRRAGSQVRCKDLNLIVTPWKTEVPTGTVIAVPWATCCPGWVAAVVLPRAFGFHNNPGT